MDLKNCTICGKLFIVEDDRHRLCPDCRKDEEADFQKVKKYLWENPRVSIEEVHQATGVAVEMILDFIKQDRLITESRLLENGGLDLRRGIELLKAEKLKD